MPNVIRFSHNWNGGKLNLDFFTTIRKPDKHNYYANRIGETFDVLLNDVLHCKAILVDAELTELGLINPELLILDTGTRDWQKVFNKFGVIDKCTLLLFEREK